MSRRPERRSPRGGERRLGAPGRGAYRGLAAEISVEVDDAVVVHQDVVGDRARERVRRIRVEVDLDHAGGDSRRGRARPETAAAVEDVSDPRSSTLGRERRLSVAEDPATQLDVTGRVHAVRAAQRGGNLVAPVLAGTDFLNRPQKVGASCKAARGHHPNRGSVAIAELLLMWAATSAGTASASAASDHGSRVSTRKREVLTSATGTADGMARGPRDGTDNRGPAFKLDAPTSAAPRDNGAHVYRHPGPAAYRSGSPTAAPGAQRVS